MDGETDAARGHVAQRRQVAQPGALASTTVEFLRRSPLSVPRPCRTAGRPTGRYAAPSHAILGNPHAFGNRAVSVGTLRSAYGGHGTANAALDARQRLATIIKPALAGGRLEQSAQEFMASNRLFGGVWWLLAVAFVAVAVPASGSRRRPPKWFRWLPATACSFGSRIFPARNAQGTPEAKQVTPVVLLHDHKETRAIFNSLAQHLQAIGDGREGGRRSRW